MSRDKLVKIKNIHKMTKQIGRDLARMLSIPIADLKYYIKPREVKSIIQQYCVQKNGNLCLNTSILHNIFDCGKQWVIGIQMSKLASEDKIDVYWDDEQNCATFKSKE